MNLSAFRFTRGKACATAFALSVSFFLVCSSPQQVRAQGQDEAGAPRQEGAPRERRPGGDSLLLQLNLTPEQLGQLREIRRQSETEARTLGRRLHAARRALDEAIYADELNEALIEERVREAASAQAALARLRAQTELRVRRVLTPEQLQSFRDLRQQARRRHHRPRRPDAPDERPAGGPGDPANNAGEARPFPHPRERRRRP